jgi:monoamine oxidase
MRMPRPGAATSAGRRSHRTLALAAATDLDRAGHTVAVLEARERVGGRTLNHPVGRGKEIEVGGEWVGPGQNRVLARARAHGIKTFKTFTRGAQVLDYAGKLTHFTGLTPPLPEPDATDFGQLLSKIVALQDTVPLDKPWTAVKAATLDGQTLETFKLANSSTPGARFLFDLATKAILAAEPRDVSLLHAMFYFHSGTGVLNLASTSVAMAPMFAGRIDYEPALPALRYGLTQKVPQGSVIKYQAVYNACSGRAPRTPRRWSSAIGWPIRRREGATRVTCRPACGPILAPRCASRWARFTGPEPRPL